MDVFIRELDYSDQKAFDLAFFSDLHIDSHNFKRSRCKRDMDYAMGRGARMFLGGDIADLILPKDVRRYKPGTDTIKRDAQLNIIITKLHEFLYPYRNHIDWIGIGNHEESCIVHNSYDMTLALVTLLNQDRDKSLPPIHHGGYKSFIRLRFTRGAQRRVRTLDILHFHGAGGGAPISKGMIDFARLRNDYDADIYWLGHKHHGPTDKPMRVRLNKVGEVICREQRCIMTPGYQSSYAQEDYNEEGYRVNFEDRQLTATSMGCVFVVVDVGRNETWLNLRVEN